MANSGDKITSWSDLYDAINRVIELPATGSATAFTTTTVLDNTNVTVGDKIDDDDLNNLIDRYNALKADPLYGSSDQLDTNHTSTTVSLYATNPNNTSAGSLLQIQSENDVQAIVNSLNNIQCRNIVTCNNATETSCTDQTTACNDCSDTQGCNRSYYYTCDRYYYSTCSNNPCNKRTDKYTYSCYAYGSVCGYSSPKKTTCYFRLVGEGTCYDCSQYYYNTCDNTGYYDVCRRSYYYYCSRSYYYTGCNQTYYTPCNRGTHNDIQCNNTEWSGS